MDTATNFKAGHYPRLLFNSSDIERLKNRIRESDAIRQAWNSIIERAESLLTEELVSEEYADEPDTQHGNYGRPGNQITEMGMTLGAAYQVTGDERYAAKLRDALLHYSAYRKWCGKGSLTKDPAWHSELNTARFCFGFGVGYDCIHDFLSTEERRAIADGLIRNGILPTLEDWVLPEKRVHALDSMGHNWWSVCVAQAGLAALALIGDDPRAEGWARSASDAFPQYFSYKGDPLLNKSINYDDEGAFYESVGYANYALGEYLDFHQAHVNVLGTPPPVDPELLRKCAEFVLYTCYPTSSEVLTVSFGDSSLHTRSDGSVKQLLIAGYGRPELREYIRRVSPRLTARDVIFYDRIFGEEPGSLAMPKKSVIYEKIGWAIMRSSWENDATVVAVKSGFTWNHAHADAGSFMVLHKGSPVLFDAGSCSYARREYGEYYCQSRAHNVVLFNGQGQKREDLYRGSRIPGQVKHLVDLDDLRYVIADATGPMSHLLSRDFRHLIWLGGLSSGYDQVLFVVDDLRSHEPGRFDLLLHYDGTCEESGKALVVTNGKARAFIQNLHPGNLVVSREEGLREHQPDQKIDYLKLSTAADFDEAKLITSIALRGLDAAGSVDAAGSLGTSGSVDTSGSQYVEPGSAAGNSSDAEVAKLPRMTRLEGPEWIGVRVDDGREVTDIYLNLRADGRRMHRNSNNVIDGWETDAYIVAITWAKGDKCGDPLAIRRLLISAGSYLRRDGVIVFDSLSKAYGGFIKSEGGCRVILQGQPMIRASFALATDPGKLVLNDAAEDAKWVGVARYDGATGRLAVAIG